MLEVKDGLEQDLREGLATLAPEEAAVLTLLRARLKLTLKDKLKASVDAG